MPQLNRHPAVDIGGEAGDTEKLLYDLKPPEKPPFPTAIHQILMPAFPLNGHTQFFFNEGKIEPRPVVGIHAVDLRKDF